MLSGCLGGDGGVGLGGGAGFGASVGLDNNPGSMKNGLSSLRVFGNIDIGVDGFGGGGVWNGPPGGFAPLQASPNSLVAHGSAPCVVHGSDSADASSALASVTAVFTASVFLLCFVLRRCV